MSKQYNEITMRRVCRANDVYIEVNGSIADWPPWAARAVVAAAARWCNNGFRLESDDVVAEHIGEDMGGHPIMRVAPAITNGPCFATAGERWQAALEAVVAAQRD